MIFSFFKVLPSQVGAVVTRIGEKYREAALALVAKAYSTIRIADLAVYLGQVIVARTRSSAREQVITCFPFLNACLTRNLRLNQRRERRWQPWAGLKNQEWSVLSYSLIVLILVSCLPSFGLILNNQIVQVTPKSETGKKATVPPTEDQLNRLTDFIAFLEN